MKSAQAGDVRMETSLPDMFCKYVTAHTARAVLANSSLRWSAPRQFNDPFDMQFDLHLELDRDTVQKLSLAKLWEASFGETPIPPTRPNQMSAVVALLRASGIQLTPEQFAAEMGEVFLECYDIALRELPLLATRFREKFAASKVLCVCEVPDSLPMWAYYAEGHRGAVLCFRPAMRHSLWLAARPVAYSAEMPRLCDEEVFSNSLAGLHSLDPRTIMDKVIYTKAEDWAHEREWRLEVPGPGKNSTAAYEDVPFDPRDLVAVILGCAMPSAERDELSGIVHRHYPHAQLLVGTKDSHQFRLVIRESQSPSGADLS